MPTSGNKNSTENRKPENNAPVTKNQRKERLVVALRQNLKRRKEATKSS